MYGNFTRDVILPASSHEMYISLTAELFIVVLSYLSKTILVRFFTHCSCTLLSTQVGRCACAVPHLMHNLHVVM